MNPGMIGGIIGGLVGSIIGLAGGIIGTYFSIKNTNGPRERSFTIKASIVCWIAILLFLALFLILPNPYKWFMWIPYAILLPLGIMYWNKTQQRIRQEESQNQPSDRTR
jgi:Ca2+/Na+ antiporter